MGTYTTNYQLFMPSVGETGWGTLVNGNFITIDTTMKGLDTRLTAVESEVNGALRCTSVTATTGTCSGAVTGASFNNHVFKNNGVYTVTSGMTTTFLLPAHGTTANLNNQVLTLLPVDGSNTYTGSIKFTSDTSPNIAYYDGVTANRQTLSMTAGTITTLSFTNIKYLTIAGTIGGIKCYTFTIS